MCAFVSYYCFAVNPITNRIPTITQNKINPIKTNFFIVVQIPPYEYFYLKRLIFEIAPANYASSAAVRK